jgi:fructose-1,6-bisphosphatase I
MQSDLMDLETYLLREGKDEFVDILLAIATSSLNVREELPISMGLTKNVNASGERQAKLDIFANDEFASSLLQTGSVAEIASEEMTTSKKGSGAIHVAMDPLDGSSNISTNNPLGSIFGFYSSGLPCSGESLLGAAFVTYGPMLTMTFSLGKGVSTFVTVEGKSEGAPIFVLLEDNIKIPEKPEVFGLGGQRREWIEPVEKFVESLESRGLKLRYGGTFVGDYNQVLRYGGIFGYPALRNKPRGKLRVLYEAAPMAYITKHCGGYSSDGSHDILTVVPESLADSTPLYLGSTTLVKELEALIGSGP